MGIKQNIRKLRKLNDMNQEDVARHLGITRAAYGMYESGARDIPHSKQEKIAQLYGLSVAQLHTEDLDQPAAHADDAALVADTLSKEQLQGKSKEEIIEMYLQMQERLSKATLKAYKLEQERNETRRVLRSLMGT